MESGILLALAPLGERAVTLTASVGGETVSYTVGRSVWERLGSPSAGEPLTAEALASLARASEAREAYGLAVRILESGEVNGRTLLFKLSRKGVSREAAVFALARMRELGYIDERGQAERYAASMSRRNLWGRRRIVAELIARGYSAEDAEAGVTAACAAGEIDFSETKTALTARLSRRGAQGDRLAAALYRCGYGADDD